MDGCMGRQIGAWMDGERGGQINVHRDGGIGVQMDSHWPDRLLVTPTSFPTNLVQIYRVSLQPTLPLDSFILFTCLAALDLSCGTRIFDASRVSFIVAHGLSSCGEQV